METLDLLSLAHTISWPGAAIIITVMLRPLAREALSYARDHCKDSLDREYQKKLDRKS